MDIKLRAINVNYGLSDETYCYTASLYVDGRRVAIASNRGFGGPDSFDPVGKVGTAAFQRNKAALEAAEAYAKSLPPLVDERYDLTLPMDLELLVGQLIDEHNLERDRKKLQRLLDKRKETAVCFREPGDDEFTFWSYDLKGRDRATVEAMVTRKHPGAEIL